MSWKIDKKITTGILIPTYNAAEDLEKCLKPLLTHRDKYKFLMIDSSSQDGTAELARKLGVPVSVIPTQDFNHGITRELGRKMLDTDIVVYMTQDAIPENSHLIEFLIRPLIENIAAVSYARQLPHKGATLTEAYLREFNYPGKSQIRSIKDLDKYGVQTFFCSNSCAAYLNRALDEIGGFESTLSNEDYIAVAKLLKNNYKIAYVSEARVFHSHRYTLRQDFLRYFDIGYVRAENKWIEDLAGPAEHRGAQFATELLKCAGKEQPWLLPYILFSLTLKWLGYRLGYYGRRLPLWLKKLLSGQKNYWTSKYYSAE
jgi:rhamnosyltransferase